MSGRRFSVWLGFVGVSVLVLAGCSGSTDDTSSETLAPTTETSSSTSLTTTSTTEPTTTSLSERAEAEAEIERIITEWWTTAYNPDTGDGDGGAKYLTGLLATRIQENNESYLSEGKVGITGTETSIEITSVEIDLERGTGSATSCGGSDFGFHDIETRELIDGADDPHYQTTSDWLVELTDDGWKISEWYASWSTGNPIECTVTDS